jgi:hypothetical protein
MWILSICVGILWGGMCNQFFHLEYPTVQACEFEMNKLNYKLWDGHAICYKEEEGEDEKE